MRAHALRRWTLVVAACLVPCCGCISADVLTFINYDKAADSFGCPQVYANIATKDEGELNQIEKLWKLRSNLIVDPSAPFAFLASPFIFERRGKHSYSRLPLGEKMKKQPEESTTFVDLDTIKVSPGESFSTNTGTCGTSNDAPCRAMPSTHSCAR